MLFTHCRATLYDSVNDAMFQTSQSPKKSRGKESSKHFGVRFRPDLAKWVAEIRVAEWRTVDKKVKQHNSSNCQNTSSFKYYGTSTVDLAAALMQKSLPF